MHINLFDGVFAYFLEEVPSKYKMLFEKNGGDIVYEYFPAVKHYFSMEPTFDLISMITITPLWILDCLNANKLLPVTINYLAVNNLPDKQKTNSHNSLSHFTTPSPKRIQKTIPVITLTLEEVEGSLRGLPTLKIIDWEMNESDEGEFCIEEQ